MKKNQKLIIDFDSTFVKVEALEMLASIALRNNSMRNTILKKIEEITNLGMIGKITFDESLKRRMELFNPSVDDLNILIENLKNQITPSIMRNKEFFQKFSDDIFIISGGFEDWILPVVKSFGLFKKNIIANKFIIIDKKIIGFDENNDLAKPQGKYLALKKLNLDGEIVVIGDGFTDYELKAKGLADKFYLFTENLRRDEIVNLADYILVDFEEFLYQNKPI